MGRFISRFSRNIVDLALDFVGFSQIDADNLAHGVFESEIHPQSDHLTDSQSSIPVFRGDVSVTRSASSTDSLAKVRRWVVNHSPHR